MNKVTKIVLGGLSGGIILILTSSFIHGFVFHKYWDSLDYIRPTDSWPFIPGAPILTTIWTTGLALLFYKFYNAIPGKGLKKGVNFGLLLFIVFIPFVEIWCYIQFEMPFMAAVAGMICYLIALPLGGLAMAAIFGKKLENK